MAKEKLLLFVNERGLSSSPVSACGADICAISELVWAVYADTCRVYVIWRDQPNTLGGDKCATVLAFRHMTEARG